MPTIDPGEFDDAGGVLTKGIGQLPSAEHDERPYDPELHKPGSAKWAEHQAHMEPETAEDRFRNAQRRSMAKIAEENAKINEAAELHKRELAKQAAEKQVDLDVALACLSQDQAREVRMIAYIRALDGQHGNARERQVAADTLALRIARYMVEGRAE